MSRSRPITSVLLVLAALALAATSARADDAPWTTEEEHWYVLELNGQKAGWMAVLVESAPDRFRTTTETRLEIGRGAATTSVHTRTSFVETAAGRPVLMRSTQESSREPVESAWAFGETDATLTTRQAGRTLTKTMPMPGGVWLTPMAVDRYTAERRAAGATEIEYRMLTPESGLEPATVRSVRTGEATFDRDGRSIPVTVWKTTTDIMPVATIEHISSDGHLVLAEMQAGIGTLTTRLSTKAKARDLVAGQGPELMMSTFVTPDRPIENVHRSRTATYRLRVETGAMPDIPSAGAQRAEREGESVVVARLDCDDPQPATEAERADASFLARSSMIDPADPLIAKLTANTLRRVGDDPMKRAEALRKRVLRHVSRKGLQTAFASASETAKTRAGDCSEHAVLLAAMLRADGIPARVATGLVYADAFAGNRDIFGWHMWTQALIDGKWIDLDATLPVTYHAGHVLTGTSTLADGEADRELGALMMLMGNLDIEVVDVGYAD